MKSHILAVQKYSPCQERGTCFSSSSRILTGQVESTPWLTWSPLGNVITIFSWMRTLRDSDQEWQISDIGKKLTKFLHIKLFHSMNACQVSNSALNSSPFVPIHFLHSFNHLLLTINPIQVIPQHSESHWLKDVGVLQGHTVSTWNQQRLVLFTPVDF